MIKKAAIIFLVMVFCFQAKAQYRMFIGLESGLQTTQLVTRSLPDELYSTAKSDSYYNKTTLGGYAGRISFSITDTTYHATAFVFTGRFGFINFFGEGDFTGERMSGMTIYRYLPSRTFINEKYLSAGLSVGITGPKKRITVDAGFDVLKNLTGTSWMHYNADVYQIVRVIPSSGRPYNIEVYNGTASGKRNIRMNNYCFSVFVALNAKLYAHKSWHAGLCIKASATAGRITNEYALGLRTQELGVWLRKEIR